QFQLGYRYDDDPPRAQRLSFEGPAVALAPGAPAAGFLRDRPAEAVLLASGAATQLAGRESQIALASSRAALGDLAQAGARGLNVVLKDVTAGENSPPYDVFLVLEGASALAPSAARIGGLDLFGGAGHGAYGQH